MVTRFMGGLRDLWEFTRFMGGFTRFMGVCEIYGSYEIYGAYSPDLKVRHGEVVASANSLNVRGFPHQSTTTLKKLIPTWPSCSSMKRCQNESNVDIKGGNC